MTIQEKLSHVFFKIHFVLNCSLIIREREFEVAIKFAANVSMHQLRELLSGKPVNTPQEALNVMDIVLRELVAQRCILNLLRLLLFATILSFCFLCFFCLFSYVSIGRFLYSPDLRKPQKLGGGLESWRGFYQSIRPTQMGLSLNVGEASTIVFIFFHFIEVLKYLLSHFNLFFFSIL